MAPSPVPKKNESELNISMSNYGSVGINGTNDSAAADADNADEQKPLAHGKQHHHSSLRNSFASLRDVASKVAFLDSTKTHHHPTKSCDHSAADNVYDYESPLQIPPSDGSDEFEDDTRPAGDKLFFSHSNLRKLALDLSLYINVFILLIKTVAYLETLSLSVLAALVDSILDVVSQIILAYTERRSSKTRSSAHYPAGASRLEPLGVLSCAALMGFASFGVLKEALEQLFEGMHDGSSNILMDENWSSFYSMLSIVVVKLGLWGLCQKVGHVRIEEANNNGGSSTDGRRGSVTTNYYVDSTLEALALDHWNDFLSNAVAAIALLCTFSNEHLWILVSVRIEMDGKIQVAFVDHCCLFHLLMSFYYFVFRILLVQLLFLYTLYFHGTLLERNRLNTLLGRRRRENLLTSFTKLPITLTPKWR